ncbi:unnamed protein product [Allacma fusca]|uniref:Uncharacterized protein n=1 Tax=Allacma fusca TaxID=39272 RepID=A0A8J2K7U7_9HEXA|nr:unnamed protein product [Allacma fusca]
MSRLARGHEIMVLGGIKMEMSRLNKRFSTNPASQGNEDDDEDDDDGPAHEEKFENYTDDSEWVLPAKSMCVESDDDVVDEDEDEDEYGTPGDSSSAASTEDSSDNAQQSQTSRNAKSSETEISEDPEFQNGQRRKNFERRLGVRTMC